MPDPSDLDYHWWAYGNYVSPSTCPNCNRDRLMSCEDNDKRERIICEKCHWEPARNDYCFEALGD